MGGFDLPKYLELFPKVCLKKFNREYDFPRLEKEFDHLRRGARALVARDVLKIFDPKATPFDQRYWRKPNAKELDEALKNRNLMLAPIPDDPRKLVRALLSVFHDIGTTSLVLRFVHPDRFGIFSTPIVNLLQVHGTNTADLYFAYCNELRVWKEHFGMKTVAETEMALWTYQQLATESERAGRREIQRGFDEDVWIQRRRTAHAVTPFIAQRGPLELARILAEAHPNLAAMIAGVEYERLLRCAARKFGYGTKKDRISVEMLINQLAGDGHVSLEDATQLRAIWSVRNQAVHPDDLLPTLEEVENMIERIARICSRWDT